MHRLSGFILLTTFGAVAQTPDTTLPPAKQQAILTLQGAGSQVYRCEVLPVGFQWVFKAPVARLFDAQGKEVGTHGEGPTWTLNDSSSIAGVKVAETPASDASSIPSLLLKGVRPLRTGLLTTVEYIRRSDAKGGVASPTRCDAAHEGDLARVPYTATYTFYAAQR